MKVTIITVCYNSAQTIEQTIQSVLSQSYNPIEYIIKDGLSTDRTSDIIKKYEDRFNGRLRYISEKDSGIYDAMNRGISLATGDIIGILNSDDVLADNEVISKIVNRFRQGEDIDAVYANLVFKDEKTLTKTTRVFVAGEYTTRLAWHPPHPTLYLKRKVYEEIGYFDTRFKIAADYDLMLRIIRSGKYKFAYINEDLVFMRDGGASTAGIQSYFKSFQDSIQVMKKNKVKFPYLVNTARTLKFFYQKLR